MGKCGSWINSDPNSDYVRINRSNVVRIVSLDSLKDYFQ